MSETTVPALARDSGLARTMGPLGLAASTFNVVIAAAIFLIPSTMAASADVYAPFAFLVCAIAMSGVVACFAEGGRRIATSGGCYGYIEAAFGPRAGFVAGFMLLLSNLLGCGGITAALAQIVAGQFSGSWQPVARVAAALIVLGAFTAINILGTRAATRTAGLVTALKLVALAVFLVAGLQAVEPQNLVPRADFSPQDFGRSMILGLFAMTGMEIALCASGEVRDPQRSIPRALLLVMVSTTVIYMTVQFIAQGVLGSALPGSSAPLADAMARVSPILRWLLLSAAVVSMLGYLGVDLLGSPRLLLAFARDGYLPQQLGSVHPRRHTPVVAIACYALVAAALALTGTFSQLAVLAALAAAAIYIAGCAAVWLLARRQGTTPGWLPYAAVLGIASMLAMIGLAAPAEIVGLLGSIAAGVLLYQLRGWSRPG